MTSFLESLQQQRQKFLDGLDANMGDINLDIFEDFYPDQAHFVFELLQNAEDTGATAVSFSLHEGGCWFGHNGIRAFTDNDVRSITGIHNSTKVKAADQIGKFGVGFKSVFVYTLTPTIYSTPHSFRIVRLVMPEPVVPETPIEDETRFWFPFDNPKKPPDIAFREVLAGLEGLAETTLLFLSNIESIKWTVGGGWIGEVLRVQHSSRHLEVLKRQDATATTSLHFLKFDQAVTGMETQRVAIAYPLEFLTKVDSFDPRQPLSAQMKIVPATPGKVAVFFPAEKEASGLRFHLHAPFVPELSRASVKATAANQPLFEQLAVLAASSLDEIRDFGLLNVDFLAVLPNPKDDVRESYKPIRAAIVEAMKTRPLTPTQDKKHAPATQLIQSKASLKELLSSADLEFLVTDDEGAPQWAANAPQRNSAADQFLSGLDIREWGIEEFVSVLEERSNDDADADGLDDATVKRPRANLSSWLSRKSVSWHQELYALLFDEFSNQPWMKLRLSSIPILKLKSGGYGGGVQAFFPAQDDSSDDFEFVDQAVYEDGKSKAKRDGALEFLRFVGVREVGDKERVENILRARYTSKAAKPHKRDLRTFIDAWMKSPSIASLFSSYFVFQGADGQRHRPGSIFIDKPLLDTGLSAYYDALGVRAMRFALARENVSSSVDENKFVEFAKAVGAQVSLYPDRISINGHPSSGYLKTDYRIGDGSRFTSTGENEDWSISHLSELIKRPTERLSLLIWRTMCAVRNEVLFARFRPNQRYQLRTADSTLVLLLRDAEWVPQGDGKFVKPCDASRDLLPAGFAYDPGWQWLKAVKFGDNYVAQAELEEERAANLARYAEELGFAGPDAPELVQRLAAVPVEDLKDFLDEIERRSRVELPENEPANPSRRAERVAAEANDAPERRTEERTRSVSIGRDEEKRRAAPYLAGQYTNAEGAMVCQICKAAMPFKVPNGEWYFEKVEFLTGLKKHHYQNYLALCPNHAAMFQYSNGSKDMMAGMFEQLTGNYLEVVLADRDETIYFTGTHIADLKAVIASERQESGEEPDGSSS